MTGLVDKAIAKINQNELDWYDIFFNTAYSVSKKTGYSLTAHSYWMFVLTLLKLYFKFYAMML